MKNSENKQPDSSADSILNNPQSYDLDKPKALFSKIDVLLKKINSKGIQTDKIKMEKDLLSLSYEVVGTINNEIKNIEEQMGTTGKWIESRRKVLTKINESILELVHLSRVERNKLLEIAKEINNKLNELKARNDELKKARWQLANPIDKIKSFLGKTNNPDQPPTEEEKPLPEEPIVIQNESPEKPITQENKINNLQDVKNEIISFTKQLLDNNSEEVLNNFSKSSLEGLVKKFTELKNLKTCNGVKTTRRAA
jgi:hypothetical protein